MTNNLQFNPDYAVHPGEILLDIIEARDISQAELSRRCNKPEKTISAIINCNTSITPDTAISLERVLGISAKTWVNMDTSYKMWHKKKEAEQELSKQAGWIKKFPYNEMKKRGLIEDCKTTAQKIEQLFKFFGVGDFKAFENHINSPISASLRHSPAHQGCEYALHTWLREGEIIAKNTEASVYNKDSFKKIIPEIRRLTNLGFKKAIPKIQKICKDVGVILVILEPYQGVVVNGVARKIKHKDSNVLVQLSLRGKKNDIFWFSLFHEFGHVLKHLKREIRIDGNNHSDTDCPEETEANSFASKTLISDRDWNAFIDSGFFNQLTIKKFAKEVNIPTGIVVGRLQKEGRLEYKKLNNLKEKIDYGMLLD